MSSVSWWRRLTLHALVGALVVSSVARAMVQDEDELLEALGDVALFVDTEVLVAGATRRVSKLSESPGTITVIDAQELDEWGALTLEEALRYVTSVTFAPGSVSLSTRIRDIEQGFSNKVLLLFDGRLVNSVFRGNHFVDLAQPIDNVARIEVVRGPGSALYGANAFAGFINVVTRRGDEVDGVEVSLNRGSHGLNHVNLIAGGMKGPYNWLLDVRHAGSRGEDLVNVLDNSDHEDWHLAFHWGEGDSKGEKWFVRFDLTDVHRGVPGELAGPTPNDRLEESRWSFDGFKLWEPSKKTKLKLRGYYNHTDGRYAFSSSALGVSQLSDRVVSGVPPFFYDDQLDRLPTSSVRPNPLAEPDLGCVVCDQAVLSAGIDGSGRPMPASVDLWNQIITSGIPQVVQTFDSDESLGFVELQADWQISDVNYLLGGVSIRLDDVDNGIVGDRQFENYAAFIEDEHRFLDGELILLGSLRFDDHSFFGSAVSPRVSVIWSPRKELILKAAYGRAFRSPNFVELFGQQDTASARVFGQRRAVEEGVLPESFQRCLDADVTLSDCDAERIETLDTELDQEQIETLELWTEFTPFKKFKAILNLYSYEIENEVGLAVDRDDLYFYIDREGAGALGLTRINSVLAIPGAADTPTLGIFLNAPDRTKGRGAELELLSDPWDWLSLRLKYSRRLGEKAEVRDFVEATGVGAESQLVPAFGLRRFHVDQLTSLITMRRKDNLWGSLRLRVLGRPKESLFSQGEAVTADLTVGWRRENLRVAGSVFNLNEGGLFFDPAADRFIEGQRDFRLAFSYVHGF
ncbi:MAG: TonB-dependent receptor [Acidobacteriota bacterium]